MDDQDPQLMTVRGLTLDPVTNAPIVILKAEGGARLLPIWIGLFEANAIALVLENITSPRPMTHDLLKNVIELLDASVRQVVVDSLRENTFYASVYLRTGGQERRLDARPSDAIALALRAGAPIFVTRDVLSRTKEVELVEDLGEPEQWRQWLERIQPADFGAGGGRGTADDPERNGRAD
ncbi:MAG TPA: bifunctional nuclease family protein [bacterium]